MNALINLTALIALAAVCARAGDTGALSIVFDDPNQSGLPGQTLSFYGTITNTDTTPGDGPIDLNSDSLDFTLADATVNDNFFILALPVCDPTSLICSLAEGASSGDLDLFDITLANPETEPLGTYKGTYGLIGGIDDYTDTAQDNLGQADFAVTVTPEPGSLVLLWIGLALIGWRYSPRRLLAGPSTTPQRPGEWPRDMKS